MANITIQSDGAEQTYALEAPNVTLGRGLESDIRLKDIKASRRHCQISKTPQGYQVTDLSSGNGTYINGVQIKQQALSNGDKIQIGSTTITFQEGAAAKPAARPAAAAAVAGKPAAPATQSASASRPATSQIPVAPTKKITAKVDAVKPATRTVPKPGTQPVPKKSTRAIGKVGTQGIEKPRTTGMKKATARGGTGRTGKITASQRFHAEGRRKKSNPVMVIIGIIGAGLIIAIGVILWPKGPSNELIVQKLEKIEAAANELDENGDFGKAIKKYEEALALIQDNDYFKGRNITIKAKIDQIKKDQAALEEANKQFAALKKDFMAARGVDEHNALLEKAKRMLENYKPAPVAWIPDLRDVIARIDKVLDTEAEEVKKLDFQTRRNEITQQFGLGGDPLKAEWGGAIEAWNEYLKNKLSESAKNKAEADVININRRARDNFARVRTRVNNLLASNDKAGAVDMLKKERPRFKGTESEADLEKLIGEVDK